MSEDKSGITGELHIQLIAEDGTVKLDQVIKNLITTAGDEYYSQMGMALVGTPNTAQPTKVNGMKLGSGTTAVAKSGAGAALVTYISASNVAFDSAYPTATAVAGTDTGWQITYQTTFGAGVATGTIQEAVIVTDEATNATSTAANTISRALTGAITKGSSDTLIITWTHKFLGA